MISHISKESKKFSRRVDLAKILHKKLAVTSTALELAEAYTAAGMPAEALDVYAQCLRDHPDARRLEVLVAVALLQNEVGQHEEAFKTAREAFEIAGREDSQIVRYISFIYAQSGHFDDAFALIEKAKKLEPDDPVLNEIHGSLLALAGKNDEAVALYKSMLQRDPNDEEVEKIARLGLSIAYVNKDDYVKGEKELEILLEKLPDDPGVNNDLGYLYAEQGKNLEKAESMVRKAVESEKENSSYLDSLGWVLFKRGKLKEAVAPLELAVKLRNGSDSTLRDHLGDVFFSLQEFDKAKTQWEEAIRLGKKAIPPEKKRIDSIQKKLEGLKKLDVKPKPAGEGSI